MAVTLLISCGTASASASEVLPFKRLAWQKIETKWKADAQAAGRTVVTCNTWEPKPMSMFCTFYDPAPATTRPYAIFSDGRHRVYVKMSVQRREGYSCHLIFRAYRTLGSAQNTETIVNFCEPGWWRRLASPIAP